MWRQLTHRGTGSTAVWVVAVTVGLSACSPSIRSTIPRPPTADELAELWRAPSQDRDLYWGVGEQKGLCAHCHEPKAMRDTSGGGKRRLKVTMVSQREIGTDSLYLDNFAARRVDTGPLGMGHLSAKDASKLLTDAIMKRAGVMEDSEYRDIVNEWSDSRQFIARPHVAVWATGPYLHNGSVPTLHELLSPDKRRDCFSMSPNMKYDPENVGFVVSECGQTPAHGDPAGGFDFNTLLPGNSNRGHEFRNTPRCGTDDKEDGVLGCEIKPEHRVAIIEYLKTCDLDLLVVEKDPRPCQDVEQRRRHAATRGTPLP